MNEYKIHSHTYCIVNYVKPDDFDTLVWLSCPRCKITPLVWQFDNGRATACGCWETQYNHFTINAESIMSVHIRNDGDLSEYSKDDLRLNWNHYCNTGEIKFDRNLSERW